MEDNFIVKYKSILLETFKSLIDFLDKEGLNYYVCGGTAIGAVRHNGFIPWDDDVDIFMPRKDYKRLKELFLMAASTEYELLTLDNDDAPITYMKFVNKNTTFWELRNIAFISGVFVDIFPLDFFDGNSEEFIKRYKYIKRLRQLSLSSLSHFSITTLIDSIKHKNKKHFLMSISSLFIPRFFIGYLKNRIKAFDEECERVSEGSTLVSFYGSYGAKEFLKKEWFEDSILYDFSTIQVKVPVGYDAYLSHCYGDYMKLPPVEKRVYEHNHYYVNLKERISLEEAKRRVRMGIKEEL